MPTARSEARNLANLAVKLKKFGWSVEKNPGGKYLYRITAPNGERIQLHSSPSDGNWLKVVTRWLEDHGWSDAMQKLSDEEKAEKLRRKDLENEENEKKTTQLKAKSIEFSAERAAGKLVPQVVDAMWLLKPHPFPEIRRVLITPDVAEVILQKANTGNRPLRQVRVEHWRTQIKNGRWRYTHQGIAIDNTGTLQDGQHRLSAAVLEGFTLDINVSVGMDPENFGSIDVGANRTGADTLALLHKEHPNTLAGAVKLILLHDWFGSELRSGTRTKITNDQVQQAVAKYGKSLEEAVDKAHSIRKVPASPKMSPISLAAGIFEISRTLPKDQPEVEEFLRGFTYATDLPTGDARIALRTYMFNLSNPSNKNRKVPVWEQLGVFIKAWNAWMNNRSITNLALRANELFPNAFVPPPPTD